MNRQFVLTIIVIAAVFAGATALAQQHRAYNLIMKDVGATFANLKKNLDENSGAAAAQDAAKPEALFTETEGFWAPLNTQDAVNMPERARKPPGPLGTSAKSNRLKSQQ